LTFKYWLAIALVVGASACDYTPELPPAPAPTPRPSAATEGGIPVIVVPVASPGPGQTPQPGPVSALAMFKIVLATPSQYSTINLTASTAAAVHRPTLDFEFRFPVNLTLDDDFTNIEIALLIERSNSTCLTTDLGHSIRLDRDDKVYLANSVALFRTGIWRRNFGASCARLSGSSFTTNQVLFKLTPDVAYTQEIWNFIPMQWTFVVQ